MKKTALFPVAADQLRLHRPGNRSFSLHPAQLGKTGDSFLIFKLRHPRNIGPLALKLDQVIIPDQFLHRLADRHAAHMESLLQNRLRRNLIPRPQFSLLDLFPHCIPYLNIQWFIFCRRQFLHHFYPPDSM